MTACRRGIVLLLDADADERTGVLVVGGNRLTFVPRIAVDDDEDVRNLGGSEEEVDITFDFFCA